MSDFDDEIRKRQSLINVLEDPGASVSEEVEEGLEHAFDLEAGDVVDAPPAPTDVLGGDEIATADRLARSIPGGLSGLEGKTSLRAAKWSGLRSVASFARINPPTVLQGITGNQAEVVPGGPMIQVANWGGEDAETLPITVTFAPVTFDIPLFLTNKVFRPVGIVQFGTKGFLVKAFVDIGKGCQFTVSGSSCTLQVGLDPDNISTGPYDGLTSMKLAGMLSFWPIEREMVITRTVYIDLATPGPTLFPVPPFAKEVWVLKTLPTLAAEVFFFDSGGNQLYEVDIAGGTQLLDPIPLSDDVVSMTVRDKATPTHNVTGRLVFGLEF